jgi:hypothetical protein
METSDWVRRVGVTGFLGPMGLDALRAAVDRGEVSLLDEARAAVGSGRPEVLDDGGWIAVHAALGVGAPPPPLPTPKLPPPALQLVDVRAEVRGNSAYRGGRRLLACAFAAWVGDALLPLASLLHAAFSRRYGVPRPTFGDWLIEIGEALLWIASAFALWHLARALLDLADCHLLRRAERAKL